LLSESVRSALGNKGIKTIGDLVACDSSSCPPGIYTSDWNNLNDQLKRMGLSLPGAPVPCGLGDFIELESFINETFCNTATTMSNGEILFSRAGWKQ